MAHTRLVRAHERVRPALLFAATAAAGVPLSLSLELANRGFDVLHRRGTVDLLLLERGTGAVVVTQPVVGEAVDPRTWQPCDPRAAHFRAQQRLLRAAARLGRGGTTRRGLRIAVVTYNRTALPTPLHVRVANDLPWDAATGISTLAPVDPWRLLRKLRVLMSL